MADDTMRDTYGHHTNECDWPEALLMPGRIDWARSGCDDRQDRAPRCATSVVGLPSYR
ncbi:hypothetical protein PATSB16_23580 [Pandoraea thiooxydans]|nr:hypothetical protein PATSB16_23580 [Pandoraea thiooxydans]